jgi:tryptophanyl-tRNA synthetase
LTDICLYYPMTDINVTPWEVNGSVDYMKLINRFGCQPIDEKIIERFEKVTGKKAHIWLKRGIFFSHRDLNLVLDRVEKKEPVYIYTGRGSSGEIHFGHLIPFMFTKYLQDALDAIVIIQMSDTEKYYFKDGLKLEEANRLAYENAKDIIACGFNADKTYIFSDLDSMGGSLYKNTVHLMRTVTGNQIRGTYGLNLDNNIGELSWPCFQAAPAFSSSFKSIFGNKQVMCLVPMAIDQDPYFRTARDFADKMGYLKPAAIHSKFLSSLEGVNSKMSSTSLNQNSVIFLTDTPKDIKKKMSKAFSGGKDTVEEHREKGGNLDVDIAYHYLTYFLEDDKHLKDVADAYKSGKMLSGEIKKLAADVVVDIVLKHQENRKKVTDDVLKAYFKKIE